jgi:hypothetical protein
MKAYLWLTLFAMVTAGNLGAQSVYAQVSAKKVQTGVPFEYAVVISVNATNFTPPGFGGLEVVNGPSQSSSVQFVNGVMSQQMIFSYALVARKEGKYTIGPAYVTSGNQRFETQPVSIEAVKGPAGSDPSQGGRAGDDIFIRTSVSKNRFFLGEQVVVTQKVYSRSQIIGYQKSVAPAYDGFFTQALESPTKGQLVMENVDGVNYYTHEIFRTAVIANKSGKIVLNPVEVVPVIRRQGGKPKNLFEQLLGGAGYEDVPVTVRSRPVTVDVLDLPEQGKPESFNGAVGNFTAKAELTRSELKANDAVSLRITVSGKGNLRLVNAPELKLPDGFESYEPRVSEAGNSKTFEYLIIPRREGEYEIRDLEFSYFNLDTKKYVVIPSPELRLKVLPGDAGSGAQVFVPQHHVKETENDIRYIKKGELQLAKRETEFFNSPGHIVLLSLPLCALAGSLFVRRRYVRANSNVMLVNERRAASMARKRLVKAEAHMKHNSKDEFYAETLTALHGYLSYKLHIPVADLTREHVIRTLQSRKVDEQTVNLLSEQLEQAEYARYAPAAVSGDLRSVYDGAVKLVSALEQQLNRKTA